MVHVQSFIDIVKITGSLNIETHRQFPSSLFEQTKFSIVEAIALLSESSIVPVSSYRPYRKLYDVQKAVFSNGATLPFFIKIFQFLDSRRRVSKLFASAGRAARPPSRNVLVKVVRTTFCLVVPLQFCHKRQKSIFRVKPRRPFVRTTRLDAIRRKRSLFPPPLYLLSLRCMENGRRTCIEKSRERERER